MKKWVYVFCVTFGGVAIGVIAWLSHRDMTEKTGESLTGKTPVIEYVHAEGRNKGRPMDYLPIFTPQDGKGKGPPIYDYPKIDLSFSLSSANRAGIRSITMKYLGSRYTLTETVKGSFAFTNKVASLSLSDEIEAPYVGGVQKWITLCHMGR